ncbi:putative nucleotide pyrophosphatase precursor [Suhomyces tanzawaensis NRRL Y-17324]|uniref:Putative nucleotide pyrophosphatase n=1 Tax=Suhomyces tanzawaensis NRRL Y-17324 TaxID=984487 RepID=A0A1E4SB11_9ASCO|nr:putative nucleotide pyrophosphatase precursor [Suhomyces tanzawaensis NRRL Y-17324]ODV76665.1 putative nucleotide pyrophosphatase precursor [Suhomyces tanzawaensis NRRL Y-17324]
MSVNYAQPHQVDVPVTDMDEVEDDLFVNRQDTAHDEFLDGLDYEHQEDGFANKIASTFSKFGLFTKNKNKSNNYEMLGRSRSDDSYYDDLGSEADANDNKVIDFRDYKIDLLMRKVKKLTAVGIMLIISMVAGLLYFTRKGGSLQSPLIKTLISNSTHEFHPTTIVISLDGFHPHYISPHNTPTLHKMLLDDFGAPFMTPSFPSSTFPNHWTLVTGLYPSEHGIVGNTFYDPKLKKQFINTNPKVGGLDPDFWSAGEPIWQTASKQGLRSAVHMWPGSEVPGIGPKEDFDKYNGSELLSSKVDRVMSWIDRDDITQRPELILTYVPTIDQVGHKIGIFGEELVDALKYVDDFVSLMQKEIKVRNLDEIVNLIIVSDHGMAPTSNDRLIYLDDVIDLDRIEHIDGWPLFGLRPLDANTIDEMYYEIIAKLNDLGNGINKHFKVYKREDLPKEWQFGGELNEHRFNYRLAPLWIIPEVGYSITTKKQMEESGNDYKPKGVHGYNNTELLMRAIFLGTGPYFQQRLSKGKKVLPFANTEVYNLICDTLDLTPAPNNGSDTTYNAAVSSSKELPHDWTDSLEYPNVPFEVEHIIKDATYDLLWKKKKKIEVRPSTISVSTNDHPLESLVSKESSLTHNSVHIPKPTDFTDSKQSLEDEQQSDLDEGKQDTENALDSVLGNLADLLGVVSDKIGNSRLAK